MVSRMRLVLPDPGDDSQGRDYKDYLNPSSMEVISGCRLEPSLASAREGEFYQFERLGYFCVDKGDSAPGNPVFNRTVTLKDEWAKIKKGKK